MAWPPAARESDILMAPRVHVRTCSIAWRGRGSDGCTVSKRCRTCSAQAAAHSARSRWSESVRVPPRRMVTNRGSRSFGRITDASRHHFEWEVAGARGLDRTRPMVPNIARSDRVFCATHVGVPRREFRERAELNRAPTVGGCPVAGAGFSCGVGRGGARRHRGMRRCGLHRQRRRCATARGPQDRGAGVPRGRQGEGTADAIVFPGSLNGWRSPAVGS